MKDQAALIRQIVAAQFLIPNKTATVSDPKSLAIVQPVAIVRPPAVAWDEDPVLELFLPTVTLQ